MKQNTSKTTKTKKKIQHIFSVEIAKNWNEISNEQLLYIYKCMAMFDGDKRKIYILLRLIGAKVERKYKNTYILRIGKKLVTIDKIEIAAFISMLDFIDDTPKEPIRLETMRNVKAVNKELHGVTFENWIIIENYYQGFLRTRNTKAIEQATEILYPGIVIKKLDTHEIINIIMWMTSIKELFNKAFPNFYTTSNNEDIDEINMSEAMNAEIRALTGGDITKEKEILNADVWRALTELNEKCREAQEIKKMK